MSASVLLIGFVLILQALILLFDIPTARAELAPNQVVIVANAKSRELSLIHI